MQPPHPIPPPPLDPAQAKIYWDKVFAEDKIQREAAKRRAVKTLRALVSNTLVLIACAEPIVFGATWQWMYPEGGATQGLEIGAVVSSICIFVATIAAAAGAAGLDKHRGES